MDNRTCKRHKSNTECSCRKDNKYKRSYQSLIRRTLPLLSAPPRNESRNRHIQRKENARPSSFGCVVRPTAATA